MTTDARPLGSAVFDSVPFDPEGPLPTGTTVLEASAGTGKTHTIAALATRYVAEGTPLGRILLVTFGRLAAGELRGRVREHLRDAARAETGERRQRLEAALAGFDEATIATTHTFAASMLRALGMSADVDPGLAFLEDTGELATQVVTDLYLRAFGDTTEPPIRFATAVQIALDAAGDPSARIVPDETEPGWVAGSVPARRAALARAVRAEVARRKRRLRLQGFDDLLVSLRDALVHPETGEAARARLRERFDVVMVDEFQDTDPVQWQLLDTAFRGHATLVLIGDPKQAIYAFRGGDVFTYLAATEVADERRTLGTSWRSDAALLDALDGLMGGAALGDRRIRVTRVEAAQRERRLAGPAVAPLRLRVVSADQVPRAAKDGLMSVGAARAYVAADAARDIARLLASDTAFTPRAGEAPRRLQPGDVAVLASTNGEGATMRDELAALGVPVVLAAATSVFATPAARDWLTLLRALEQPHRRPLVRAAALTGFVGWTADELAAAGDAALDAHASRLRDWAASWHRHGCAALLESAAAGTTARLLGRVGGERVLTDIRHIGQVLDAVQRAEGLGPAATIAWLRDQIAAAARDGDEERSRRLDSDADAVQVVTIHRSKGLEFPVVYAPFLWNRYVESTPDRLLLHEPDGTRVRDVGGPDGPHYRERLARHQAEDLDEALRLAYVALTRAESQVVAWWAPSTGTVSAPLHRLLFGERDPHGVLPLRVPVPSDADALAMLGRLSPGGLVSVEEAHLAAPVTPDRPPGDGVALSARTFTRVLDDGWARTSYSALTADVHDAHGAVGPEAEGKTDEPANVSTVEGLDTHHVVAHSTTGSATGGSVETASLPSPMAGLPVGADFGTLVHAIYERLDFTSPDLRAALVERCRAEGTAVVAGVEPEVFADALLPSLLTPLGPLASDLRLADIASRDVLAEMEYEFPLAGGDARDGRVAATVDQVAGLLRAHLPADDPLLGYAADLEALHGRPLRGFVGGFLDVVLRVPGPGGAPRFVVADYKTNWLGPRTPVAPGAPVAEGTPALTTAAYTRAAMARAMRDAHYPLQALLYSVAVHRFLRWRLPGYDPATNLGGALYLFVRGMAGPDTPRYDGVPAGVFSWDIPPALVVALSDLLDGGVA